MRFRNLELFLRNCIIDRLVFLDIPRSFSLRFLTRPVARGGWQEGKRHVWLGGKIAGFGYRRIEKRFSETTPYNTQPSLIGV